MTAKNLIVIVIPISRIGKGININVFEYEDIMEYVRKNVAVKYDLGRFFKDQNDFNLDSKTHYSFLVNSLTREVLNGFYNSSLL